MRIYRHYNDLPQHDLGAAIAIGNFDGVHLGHQKVINTAGEVARRTGVSWGVLTFEPHPRLVFNRHISPFRLTPFHVKARMVEELGADFLIVLHFDLEFSKRTADEFISHILVEHLRVSHMVSGFDFVFGHERQGDSAYLAARGRDLEFATTSLTKVLDENGEVISSTRVRALLSAGDAEGATRLLGRPFEIEGRVITGEARGRTIGFPTANLELDTHTRPAIGVYAIRAGLDQGGDTDWHDGVANLGYRPTFDGEGLLLETHLFDFAQDLVGRHLRVRLIGHLRDESKFAGIDDLKAQIVKDCAEARDFLANARNG
jgi:riboflavin kinase/FMN adenylyltransferase